MKVKRKLVNWALIIIAAGIIVEAAVTFVIISSPQSDLGMWLSNYDPLFNLLKSSAFRPPENVVVPPTKIDSAGTLPKVTRVPGKHFVVVPQGHPIFAKPDIDSKVLEKAKRKYKLEVQEENDGWYRLEFPFGAGWVHPSVNARFLATGAPFALVKKNQGGNSSLGTMSTEIHFKEDKGRRPDAIYFEYSHKRSDPIFFKDLFEEGPSVEPASSIPQVDPDRLQKAMKLLGPEVQSKRVENFILRFTDVKWAAESEPVINSFKDTYQNIFKDIDVSGRSMNSAYIFLLPSLNAFKAFYPGAYTGKTLRTAGHYENGLIVLHPDVVAKGDRRGTLVHELTHYFNNSILQINLVSSATWLDEGLATYFGNCSIDSKGKLHIDSIAGDGFLPKRTGNSGYPYDGSPAIQIEMLQRKLRGGLKIKIKDLMALDDDSFYSADMITNYTSSWMLVHYLFNGKGGDYRQKFLSYISRLHKEAVTPDQFAAILGVSLERLEDELRAYILSK